MGEHISKYYSGTPRRLIIHEIQSIMGGKFGVTKTAKKGLYVRTLVST